MMPTWSKLGRRLGGSLAIALLVLAGSCRDITAPTPPPASPPPNANEPNRLLGLNLWGSPRLLSCPTDETLKAEAFIDELGGLVSLGGTSVSIPAGALLGKTKVELTIPAGQYMEVDLSVNDGNSIKFENPVVVTIDYSRCNRWDTLLRLLKVYHINESTKVLMENMGGIDNKITQSMTFTTLHFSGFAIAY